MARLLKVEFQSPNIRDLSLRNRNKLKWSKGFVLKYLPLRGRINERDAVKEPELGSDSSDKDQKSVNFRIVSRRQRNMPKPL